MIPKIVFAAQVEMSLEKAVHVTLDAVCYDVASLLPLTSHSNIVSATVPTVHIHSAVTSVGQRCTYCTVHTLQSRRDAHLVSVV